MHELGVLGASAQGVAALLGIYLMSNEHIIHKMKRKKTRRKASSVSGVTRLFNIHFIQNTFFIFQLYLSDTYKSV